MQKRKNLEKKYSKRTPKKLERNLVAKEIINPVKNTIDNSNIGHSSSMLGVSAEQSSMQSNWILAPIYEKEAEFEFEIRKVLGNIDGLDSTSSDVFTDTMILKELEEHEKLLEHSLDKLDRKISKKINNW